MKLLSRIICLSLSVLSVYLMSSCSKDPTPRSISQQYIDYFSYKVGTYFIMKDRLTGDIDSMYVYYNDYYKQELYEYRDIGLKGQHDSLTRTLEISFAQLNYYIRNKSQYVYYLLLYQSPFYLGVTDVRDGAGINVMRFTKNLNLNGVIYDSVFQIYVKGYNVTGSKENYCDTLLINRRQGFLRICSHNSVEVRDWELINSKIIR